MVENMACVQVFYHTNDASVADLTPSPKRPESKFLEFFVHVLVTPMSWWLTERSAERSGPRFGCPTHPT